MPLREGVLDYLNKWFAAAVAAGIAIWVIKMNVEIDSTIETLILALSPVIASYLWPPTNGRLNKREAQKAWTNPLSIDRDVLWALVVALVLYVIAQRFLPELEWLVAILPVVVGALVSP